MKNFFLSIILFFVLFCFCGVENIYAQELTFVQKIERVYNDFLKNEKIVKFTSTLKSGWTSFIKWFNNLPGIRHYNNSVYSNRNWKVAMNDMGKEYSPYLQKDGVSANMLKKGKKKWDNL